LDNTIVFPNTYLLESDLSRPVDSAIQRLKNWGLMFKILNVYKVFLIAAFIVSKKIIQQHWLKK